MKIAFDLDGTVVKQDLGILRIANLLGMTDKDVNRELMRHYTCTNEINFNPLDFISEDDELIFITGRSKEVEDLTITWAKKYFPTARVYVTGVMDAVVKENKMKDWFTLQAEAKAKIINSEGIEIYVEDCPEIFQKLRELCPNCKVLKYGSRLSTEYKDGNNE